MGTTREISQQNGTKHIQKDIVCSLEDCQFVRVNYNVSNVGPQLSYIFFADILDYFNNTKTKNETYFGKYKIVDKNITIHFSRRHSNLSCSRTHSTVLL